MAVKVCIIDDESLAIDSLRIDLERHCPEIEIVQTFQSPTKALEFVKNQKIDILFLDIDMPIMNGLQFVEQLGNFNFDVIFTTAYDQYALSAIKLKATDYLLKPVSIDDLKNAILPIISKLKLNNNTNKKPQKIALSDSTGIEFIAIEQIMYCVADKNYTTFYLLNGNKKLVSKNIGEYEKLLDADNFLRIHQSSIININYINKLTKGENASVIMQDGNELSVSRAKKSELFESLQKLL